MADEVFNILSIFNYLGLTPDKLVPLILLALVLYIIFHKKLHSHLSPIKHAIVEIQSIMSNSGSKISQSLTEKGQSPLAPTKYGMTLINDSGLGKILKENLTPLLEELHQILKKENLTNPYDVQEKARELLINKKDDKIMADVKSYSFKHALSVETILKTGGLLLRDEYFKKHKIPKE
ncbi:hypothetical protein HZA98_00070 [Candidatus Woesearchaeota archaeon]|nr:hypothetical protein [Candidatus Woesearchaeota archaeon]